MKNINKMLTPQTTPHPQTRAELDFLMENFEFQHVKSFSPPPNNRPELELFTDNLGSEVIWRLHCKAEGYLQLFRENQSERQ